MQIRTTTIALAGLVSGARSGWLAASGRLAETFAQQRKTGAPTEGTPNVLNAHLVRE